MQYLVALFFFLGPAAAQAGGTYGFANAGVNFLDWTSGVEGKSSKRDFSYLELEGGRRAEWGELYGFFDYENPGKPATDVRTAAKGSVDFFLGKTKLALYGHAYNFTAHGFSEQNRVLGLSYTFEGEGWLVKPFLGVHDVTQTYFSGFNGYMAGWILVRWVTVAGQKFLLADWHEYEFARAAGYAAGNGGRRQSHNGAASAWWIAPGGFSLGVQWRYATDKLGTGGAMGATIYSVKYFF